jgi:hypothetical protein
MAWHTPPSGRCTPLDWTRTDDMRDADLEVHIRGFLSAINERPEELIAKQFARVEKPASQGAEDLRRYVNDLKRLYGQGLLGMYQRIASHGHAVCELTEETEITEPVNKIMTLVALDGNDVPKILAGFEHAANQLNPLAIAQLFTAIHSATAGGVSRQAERDALILDLTTYCLGRFPPAVDR